MVRPVLPAVTVHRALLVVMVRLVPLVRRALLVAMA
jgi:hypothetical protein